MKGKRSEGEGVVQEAMKGNEETEGRKFLAWNALKVGEKIDDRKAMKVSVGGHLRDRVREVGHLCFVGYWESALW